MKSSRLSGEIAAAMGGFHFTEAQLRLHPPSADFITQ